MTKNILLVNDTSLICHHGCTLLMQSIYKFFNKKKFNIKNKIYLEENCLDFLDNISDYDLILINGEGIIHGKKNSDMNKVNEILNFIKKIKSKHNLPIVIFNSTISSLKSYQIEALRLVDKIYVREKFSHIYLKNKKIKSTILPDLLSLLLIKNKKNDNHIVVTDSSIQKTTKKLFEYANFKNYKFIPILYNNYLRFLRFFIFKFILKIKINFLVNFFLYLKNLYLKKILKVLAKSEFIITGRFHGVFICIALMKPFYTFQSDTYKIQGLMEMIGISHRIIDIKKINRLKLSKFNKSEITKIKKFQKKSKKKFTQFFNDLNNLVTN
jgi:polysaccharide pyruvyl transferase WcaK-like protein